ncbi:MAG TPA: ABC transporter [Syntrophobacteraceae bacterium]|nr:ABC transporter [Syntrophobacteraceae bacterium]
MISATGVRLRLGNRDILDIPEFSLHPGHVTALVGPNGSGKSSLLLTLALLQPPSQGSIRFSGEAVNPSNQLGFRRRLAVVFQEPLLLDATVRGNLMTALRIRGIPRREAQRRTSYWLERFGVLQLARQPARTLSGGEAQRTSLARAFALEPEVLFMDEPFASLDYPTRTLLLKEMGMILRELHTTTLFVTHDYSEIPFLAQQVAVLYEGRIIRCGSIADVFGNASLERLTWVPWQCALEDV